MAFSLHDAVRAIQFAHHDDLTAAAKSEAAEIVMRRVNNISRGKDLSEADRKELVQETLLRVIQSSKPLRGQNDGAATLYLHRTFKSVFLDRVIKHNPVAAKTKQSLNKGDWPEPTVRPSSSMLRPEETGRDNSHSESERGDPVSIDPISPEDLFAAEQGLRWAFRELFEGIGPQLPGDSPQGLEDLRRLEFEGATMEDLLAQEGIHGGSSRSEMEDARDRIYQRRCRAVKRAVRKIQEYEDEGERYFLLFLMDRLRTKK
jgi:DNA-directed RNA polymerase specialized sigma24 family protein